MKRCLQKLIDGNDLTRAEAEVAMEQILENATDAQIGAFVMGMKMKGETPEEITGFVNAMLKVANLISPEVEGSLVDVVGTGGDRHNTINISTPAAIVAAAAGVTVAKHGNYSFSSLSGSADVLRELGVKIDLEPDQVKRSIEDTGIGFMLAPKFHPAMKRVVGPRKELGVRTMFNILGPLTNPTGAKSQVVGVFDRNLCRLMAEALCRLGKEHVLVLHGDGMDEISTLSETYVVELKDGLITTYTITPEDLGIPRAKATDIVGGTPEENARDILYVFNGEKGPKRDIIVVNAAAAIYVAGMADSIKEAIPIAEDAIDSGKALNKLKQFAEFTSGKKVDNESLNACQGLRHEVC